MRCKAVKRVLTSFLHTSVDSGWVVFFDIILSLPENNHQCCIGQAGLHCGSIYRQWKKSALEVSTYLPAKNAVVISAAMIWHFSTSYVMNVYVTIWTYVIPWNSTSLWKNRKFWTMTEILDAQYPSLCSQTMYFSMSN